MNDRIIMISNIFLIVHTPRKTIIASTKSKDIVLNIDGSPLPHIRSLTKPVHVASQKPMKKRRCNKKRFSNFITEVRSQRSDVRSQRSDVSRKLSFVLFTLYFVLSP